MTPNSSAIPESTVIPVRKPAPSRRSFFHTAALTGAAIAAAGYVLPAGARAATATYSYSDIPGTGDVKVLNYALLLEHLETSLYNQALARLTTGGTDAMGKKINGLGLGYGTRAVSAIAAFMVVERSHRNFLFDALGSAAILNKAPFNNVKFDFKINSMNAKQTLTLVYTAEKIGVGAYLGAISKFQTLTYLQTAGAIQGTEARHTAALAQILDLDFDGTIPTAPLFNQNNGIDAAVDPDTVLNSVSPFIVL